MFTGKPPLRRVRFAALALLATGTLFTSCSTRFRGAAVDGATNFLFSLLDPQTIVQQLFPGDEEEPADGL